MRACWLLRLPIIPILQAAPDTYRQSSSASADIGCLIYTCTVLLVHSELACLQVLGNHDFDFGPSVLLSYINQVDHPVLGACNMDLSGEPGLVGKVQKWTVKSYEYEGLTIKVGGRAGAATGWRAADDLLYRQICVAAVPCTWPHLLTAVLYR